jgi:hypothetical protein
MKQGECRLIIFAALKIENAGFRAGTSYLWRSLLML